MQSATPHLGKPSRFTTLSECKLLPPHHPPLNILSHHTRTKEKKIAIKRKLLKRKNTREQWPTSYFSREIDPLKENDGNEPIFQSLFNEVSLKKKGSETWEERWETEVLQLITDQI